jgi:hypothetical protein
MGYALNEPRSVKKQLLISNFLSVIPTRRTGAKAISLGCGASKSSFLSVIQSKRCAMNGEAFAESALDRIFIAPAASARYGRLVTTANPRFLFSHENRY